MMNLFMKYLSVRLLQRKVLFDRAKDTILLIDHSKFYQSGFFKINNLKQYKTIISDKLPDEKLLDAANKEGIEWIGE